MIFEDLNRLNHSIESLDQNRGIQSNAIKSILPNLTCISFFFIVIIPMFILYYFVVYILKKKIVTTDNNNIICSYKNIMSMFSWVN